MYNKNQFLVLSISVVMISSAFALVLLQPMSGTVIVAFGGSEAERTAIATLTREVDNVIVVQYGSFEYVLAKMRCIESMVYVGHGTDDGIQYRSGFVSSVRLAVDLKSSAASSIYILACKSGGLTDKEELGRIVAFRGIVDAEIGALAVATRINLRKGLAQQAEATFALLIAAFESKLFQLTPFLPLRYDRGGGGGSGGGTSGPYLSSAEVNHFLAVLVISVAVAMLSAYAIYHFSAHFAAGATQAVYLADLSWKALGRALLTAIAVNGATAASVAINTSFGGIGNMATLFAPVVANAVDIAVNRMNIIEWIFFIELIAIETLLIIISCGYGLAARVALAAVIAVVNAAVIGTADYYDSDGTPCGTVMEAISQIFG